MDPAEAVVDACSDLRRATIRGRRAPYKPIVLLWAIGRLWEEQGTGERLVPFETARDQVVPIFEQFGQAARSRVDPIDPLWRLQRDAGGLLWECRTERPAILRRDGVPSASTLIDVDARFGLSEVVHELLRSDRRLRVQVIHLLATQVCPPELWPELFAATGHPGFASQESLLVPISTTRTREIAMRLSRSPRFRSEVLGAYEHRCAICRASPRLGERRFGIEAAHIHWVAEGGPDDVRNGLALCVMHHRGLDRGAFTLTDRLRIEISPHLHREREAAAERFWSFDGCEIAVPGRSAHRPLESFIEWHRDEVFAAG